MHAAQEVQQQYSKGSLLLPIQSMLILDIVDMLSAAQDPFRPIPVHSPPPFLPSLIGFDSWSYCTHYKKECDNECIGCTLDEQRNEAFPVFPALLNAIHLKQVKVRMLTNNYSQPTCSGKITPLDWLSLNGVEIRFYTTTTFMHSKFMVIDHGKKTSVSSVNFSKTSFTKNREAGVVLEDCSCSAVTYYQSVFEYDWSRSTDYYVDNSYTEDEMKFITDASYMAFTVPPPPGINGAYVTQLKTYTGVAIKAAYTSPDNARAVFFSYLSDVQSSLEVRHFLLHNIWCSYSNKPDRFLIQWVWTLFFPSHHTTLLQVAIYQITDEGICDELLKLWQNGVNVSLLVSDRIVSYTDWRDAQVSWS